MPKDDVQSQIAALDAKLDTVLVALGKILTPGGPPRPMIEPLAGRGYSTPGADQLAADAIVDAGARLESLYNATQKPIGV